MSTIEVQVPGLLTTVQDLGRIGFGPMAISPSGAADPIALRVGNLLVGNVQSAAALEMTLIGGTFTFSDEAVIALTGADFAPELEGAAVPLWTALQVQPGQTLRTSVTRSGARCYLCVSGGIDVKPWLGSASTHLLSGFGGHEGRALRKRDVLRIGPASSCFRKRVVPEKALRSLAPRKILRVTPGPQSGIFSDSAKTVFYGGSYQLTEESNRMGLRLDGPRFPVGACGEMLTEGVSLGAVQITPAGSPIILFVEQQTTGGYPKIANVISADFSSLGQLRPRDQVRFELLDWKRARTLFQEQEALLASDHLIV